MTIRVSLHHVTQYDYGRPVSLQPHVVRLRPAPHCRTPIAAYSLRIEPEPHFLNWQQDPFGNYQARLVFPQPGEKLTVEVDLVAEMTVTNPFDFFIEEEAERYPFTYARALRRDLDPYLDVTASGSRFASFVELARTQAARSGRRTIDVIVDVNQLVQRTLRYDIRMEPGVFAPEETLERNHGSCRDFAWLLVQVLRSLGLAARFVSGYSIQLKADEKPLVGPAGVPVDSVDLHAWAEVFLPGAGWIGLDATSGLLAGEGHIPLACTPDPETAAAITGSFAWNKQGEDDTIEERFSFSMTVTRLEETPRVTLPYSDDAWSKITALGHAVDRSLVEGDVRLTMGGEPTFVVESNADTPEWNTAALGPTKRRYANELLHRLHERFKPGGLLHEGQGKWYPGEPLPRWALSCYFRKDGVPVWKDSARFAREARGSDDDTDARRFVSTLAVALGLDPEYALPAHEDVWYYLWRERRLPINVDPFDARLEDEIERARIARVFEQKLDKVVGYVFPLARTPAGSPSADGGAHANRWTSGRWFVRPERLYLLPGDSPMGYRLPLDSLPWVAPSDAPGFYERDPFAARDALPGYDDLARRSRAGLRERRPQEGRAEPWGGSTAFTGRTEPRFWSPGDARDDRGDGRDVGDGRGHRNDREDRRDIDPRAPQTERPPAPFESAAGVVRTAVCVEARDGVLHVFMPPVALLEDYLELCAAVEETAAALGKKIRVEGYHPPNDPRLGRLQVTPDPGVIEVNIHPASGWDELVDNTTILYEEARKTGLRAEKFMVDGRHTGTGGGNHIVLGGATANDSPALRRPDLLRSLVGYWLNHPSLSYLFSGLFVGPTSQSPRVDEARNDTLYELGIAFRKLDELSRTNVPPAPWLVDRVFRNLLVDVTGNTHRTEFCIDKLYSPDGAAGRQGLIELRSFEMPPHARMSLATQLVVRALVASFWKTPYLEPPVDWGTELHDRFALPHFIHQDFGDVIDDLGRAGFAFDPAWFAPHLEFRFPLVGTLEARGGLVVELRHALEPWHVLGEEATAGGTARYVDSSVERVEVKVRAMTDARHAVTCNGRRVPLHPTGVNGEYVAGVRYRAWSPPSALHPTIPIQSPLTFDVVDRWNDKAVAGCVYHVTHPGGRAHELPPHNSFEAEGRRAARFFRFGHTPGKRTVPEAEPNPRFPFTLDLRR